MNKIIYFSFRVFFYTALCLITQLYNHPVKSEVMASDLSQQAKIINTNQQIPNDIITEQTKVNADPNAPELKVVNKSELLDSNYIPPNLTSVQGIQMSEPAAKALKQMLYAANSQGIKGIIVYSGYRSYNTQAVVYRNKINKLRPKYGKLAESAASQLVAPPGASEHQTGLAVDLTITNFLKKEYPLNYDFPFTFQGQWLHNNAHKYGFVVRYPKDKEATTMISYEPWHFRYIGEEYANILYSKKICLEEYITELKKNTPF